MTDKNEDILSIISKKIKVIESDKAFYLAICPFHQEKTPSFFINIKKEEYYCFGCKAAGDANDFIKNYEKITKKSE